jgi:hypothetical protein
MGATVTGRDEVASLMAEVGGTLGVAETTGSPGGAWHVSSVEGFDLTVTYEPGSDRLLFRSPLGRPEASLREATYGLLLAYNGRGKETGGGSVGLDEAGGEVVLRYAAPVGAVDADGLRGLILGLLRVTSGLREYVGRKAGDQPATDPDLLRFHTIRG